MHVYSYYYMVGSAVQRAARQYSRYRPINPAPHLVKVRVEVVHYDSALRPTFWCKKLYIHRLLYPLYITVET